MTNYGLHFECAAREDDTHLAMPAVEPDKHQQTRKSNVSCTGYKLRNYNNLELCISQTDSHTQKEIYIYIYALDPQVSIHTAHPLKPPN